MSDQPPNLKSYEKYILDQRSIEREAAKDQSQVKDLSGREWTPEWLRDQVGMFSVIEQKYWWICEKHNAELASEREKSARKGELLLDASKQLSIARNKADHLFALVDSKCYEQAKKIRDL